jgi:hypothetical protein
MQDLRLSNFGKSTSSFKGLSRPGQTNSLLFSNREAMIHLGHGLESSTDPKGKLLRQLRILHRVDPSLLASHACISLAQLYQIEQGDESLFYSATLRQQAARRISRLLGVEWDTLNLSTVNTSANNIIPLQFASSIKLNGINSDANTIDQYSSNANAVFSENNSASVVHSVHQNGYGQSFASLLSSASVDSSLNTLIDSENSMSFRSSTKKTQRSHTFYWLILTSTLGAIIGFIFEEWSPYRFIWP